MFEPLLFYGVSEWQDDEEYCKRKGLHPYKTVTKYLDGMPLESVVQYIKKGYIYDVLESSQCYSGNMVTLMRLPKLNFQELLNVALTSRYTDEREGAMGIILKDYLTEFEHYLIHIHKNKIDNKKLRKQITRIVQFICEDIRGTINYIYPDSEIINLCETIKEDFYNM